MKKRTIKIIYWICLSIIILIMGFSSFLQIMQSNEHFLHEMKNMGYPLYFLRFLGIAKLVGIIALLVPGFPRIREWAYAGFVIILIAASYSYLVIGEIEIPQYLFLAVLLTSYFSWHKLQKVESQH
jgi:uncharacterized membrane protein YphA (DoxX/SURF4 family)